MAEEIIEVVIAPDGTVEMHVEGIDGMGCLAETEDLVGLLGGEVEAQELTAAAYVDGDVAVGAAEQEQQDRVWG